MPWIDDPNEKRVEKGNAKRVEPSLAMEIAMRTRFFTLSIKIELGRFFMAEQLETIRSPRLQRLSVPTTVRYSPVISAEGDTQSTAVGPTLLTASRPLSRRVLGRLARRGILQNP